MQRVVKALRKAGYYVYQARIEPIRYVGLKPGVCVLLVDSMDGLQNYLSVFAERSYGYMIYVVNNGQVYKYHKTGLVRTKDELW